MTNNKLTKWRRALGNSTYHKVAAFAFVMMLALALIPGSITLRQLSAEASRFRTRPVISAGANHSVVVDGYGRAWAWGGNSHGQLGKGETNWGRYRTPERVVGFGYTTEIWARSNNTAARNSHGAVWAWGHNLNDRLGIGSTTNYYYEPQRVTMPANITAISVSGWHTLAIDRYGAVWAWGNNGNGQLGIGSSATAYNTPRRVTGLNNVTHVWAIDFRSFALDANGYAWAWGDGWTRSLGLDSTGTYNTPQRIESLTNIIAMSINNHSLALDSHGTVWAWGSNSSGQLGIGNNSFQRVPTEVETLNNIAVISTGYSHSVALCHDGTVWAWGDTSSGQSGIGAVSGFYDTPQRVDSLNNIVALSAGEWHSLALCRSGYVWAWGWNGDGQIGIDSTANIYSTPRRVHGVEGAGYLNLTASVPMPYPIIPGNVTNSGNLSAADIGMMRAYLAGFPVEMNRRAGDVDNSGTLTAADLGLIRAYLAGFPVELLLADREPD